MKRNDIQVPARYYWKLAELLNETGIPAMTLLEKAGIRTRGLQDPDAQLRFSQVETLIDTLFKEYAVPSDMALTLGSMLTATSHSIVGFGMLNSAHVEQSLQFIARFFPLVMPTFSMHYAKQANGAVITWRPIVGMSQRCLAFHIEAMAAATYRDIRDLSRELPVFRIDQSIDTVPHRKRYLDLDGARWHFGCLDHPGIRVQFDFDASRYPLNTPDNNALRVAEARCSALQQAALAVRGSFTDWVSMMLRDAGNGQPSLADLADVLNTSTRTLNRNLKKEGCSFRDLSTQVQLQLAKERLSDSYMSITEIALSLGFTETSNFSRFFSKNTGLTPREFRNKQAEPSI